MPKRLPRTPKPPRPDVTQIAYRIVREATGEAPKTPPPKPKKKNAAAVALGRMGGAKGGRARARNLTPEQLSEIGRLGARARWSEPD